MIGSVSFVRKPRKPSGHSKTWRSSAALAERGSMTRSRLARTMAPDFSLTFLRSSVLRVADPRSVQETSWH
jgi:hypothetical protein